MRGFFRAEDGTPLFFESRGEGRALVLCYGLTCRREHWRHQIEHFCRSYRVVTFDYRGHHASGVPANDSHLTIEWCAKDVGALLRHLELEEAVIFGHSLGVSVAVETARREASRVRGLVLVCGALHDPFSQMLYTNALSHVYRVWSRLYDRFPDACGRIWKTLTRPSRFVYHVTAQLGFNPERSPSHDILGYIEGVHATPPPVFHALLRDYSDYDSRRILDELEVPTLVVAGERDLITPFASQEEIATLLPKGELVTIPGGSHNAHTDFPGEVNSRIDDFLEGIGYR